MELQQELLAQQLAYQPCLTTTCLSLQLSKFYLCYRSVSHFLIWMVPSVIFPLKCSSIFWKHLNRKRPDLSSLNIVCSLLLATEDHSCANGRGDSRTNRGVDAIPWDRLHGGPACVRWRVCTAGLKVFSGLRISVKVLPIHAQHAPLIPAHCHAWPRGWIWGYGWQVMEEPSHSSETKGKMPTDSVGLVLSQILNSGRYWAAPLLCAFTGHRRVLGSVSTWRPAGSGASSLPPHLERYGPWSRAVASRHPTASSEGPREEFLFPWDGQAPHLRSLTCAWSPLLLRRGTQQVQKSR